MAEEVKYQLQEGAYNFVRSYIRDAKHIARSIGLSAKDAALFAYSYINPAATLKYGTDIGKNLVTTIFGSRGHDSGLVPYDAVEQPGFLQNMISYPA